MSEPHLLILSVQLSKYKNKKSRFLGKKCRVLSNQSGQGTLEYMLLLVILVVAGASFTATILRSVDDQVLAVGGRLEKQLKTGRANTNTWRN